MYDVLVTTYVAIPDVAQTMKPKPW